MSFDLTIPGESDAPRTIRLVAGEALFVLGANGAGKSSLMVHFAASNRGKSRRISAHRQTWMQTDALDMTPASKVQTEQNIQNTDYDQSSRYRDNYAAQRTSMTIYEIIDSENVRARAIAACFDRNDVEAAREAARREAPIAVINDLLKQSNIPISISIHKNERLMASKHGGPQYSAAELSDGERNALLIAGSVLTAPSGTLLIIDEPERHLHRSIISPLLNQLFTHRSDCAFVISTHDHGLPLMMSGSRLLLLRSCKFAGQSVRNWEADELPQGEPVDEHLRRDLVGARRDILFVEGTENSLDRPLYSLIFPMVSVIPKGSRRNVELAVAGLRAGESLHWLRAFGIVDGDGEPQEGHAGKTADVYTLPLYSVESIYYHPWIVKRIARKQAEVTGEDSSELTTKALSAAVSAVGGETERLSRNASKKLIRRKVFDQMPDDDELLRGQPLMLTNDAAGILAERKQELDDAVERGDWEALVRKCSVRESGALNAVSNALGFLTRGDYEKAVRHLLTHDEESLGFLKGLFGDLCERLS